MLTKYQWSTAWCFRDDYFNVFFSKDYFTLLPMSWAYLHITWPLCMCLSIFYTSSQYLSVTGHRLLFISSSKTWRNLRSTKLSVLSHWESSLENGVIFHTSQEKLHGKDSEQVKKETAEVVARQWFFKHASKCSGVVIWNLFHFNHWYKWKERNRQRLECIWHLCPWQALINNHFIFPQNQQWISLF